MREPRRPDAGKAGRKLFKQQPTLTATCTTVKGPHIMASETVPLTIGTPNFNFSQGLQSFYAARGMWIHGDPQGWLSTMLGPRMNLGCNWFYASAQQIRELMRDIEENGPQGMNGWQLAQTLRRLREALHRAGEAVAAEPAGLAGAPARPAAGPRPGASAPRPFEPLVIPTHGRAKDAFNKHVMDCVRDVVDFSQGSAYMNDAP